VRGSKGESGIAGTPRVARLGTGEPQFDYPKILEQDALR